MRTSRLAVALVLASCSQRVRASPNGEWHDWQDFRGWAGAPPTVAASASGRLDAFTIDPGSNEVYRKWQVAPNGAWGEWTAFGGASAGSDAALLEVRPLPLFGDMPTVSIRLERWPSRF